MSYLIDGYHAATVAAAPASERVQFIRRTYLHLAGAVAVFVGIEAVLLSTGLAMDILQSMFDSDVAWIALMVVFVVGGIAAQMMARSRSSVGLQMARSRSSVGLQYAGLTMYVLLQAVIFLPILAIAEMRFPGQHLPLQAGIVTLAAFAGLTAAVFFSGKDFSFLGPILWVSALLATAAVIVAVAFTVTSGFWLCVLMVALASGFIIYDTSNIIHHYGTHQHVAASLELFASVALLFWYILRLFIIARDDE